MAYRLGIDVGGTFTDLVLFSEESGALVVEKVPSVPADPSEGIMDGIAKILARADAAAVDRVLNDLAGEGIEALAVCFLYSFLHPDHERAVAERARRRLPGVAVSV